MPSPDFPLIRKEKLRNSVYITCFLNYTVSRASPRNDQESRLTGRRAPAAPQWEPKQELVTALDAGFYHAFRNVEPTGRPGGSLARSNAPFL